MKLSAYILAVDSGFSPNPFGRHCTLACCKPAIRRNAEPGDIIVGSASVPSGLSGRLIYAMRVRKVLPFQRYWEHPTYRYKRPSSRTAISTRGDNIWHQVARGEWRGIAGALHDKRHRDRDLRGENALIATEFYYFGCNAIAVPDEYTSLLATTQGHRNTYDVTLITRFWNWLSRTAPKRGRIGKPSDFTEAGCRAQRTEQDDDETVCESRG